MVHFIDRRLNGKNKSAVNRQRFIRRYKTQLKKAVSDAVAKRSIQDVESGESISIPTRDISEPIFHQGKGGRKEMVHPGNDRFVTGEQIERPQGGGGQGGRGSGDASNSGEGADDFIFEISKDEYLDLLFDDLELPNMEKNQTAKLVETKNVRAGYTSNGVPANINIVRSLQNSLARRVVMQKGKKSQLSELEEQLAALGNDESTISERLLLEKEIAELKRRIAAVPFIDTFDLRFNNYVKRPSPSRAVMFCLMDVSGSMDQPTKDMAKRFYILLYLFLTRTYKNVEVVYIRHHTQAKEVNEHDFFYSQETGGTIVSSALELMSEIMHSRYPASEWNIYAAQASDGDNWADDSPHCKELLAQQILPWVRYFSYIEITNRAHQSLWFQYEELAKAFPHFAMENIRSQEDIYPVFRELFKKRAA